MMVVVRACLGRVVSGCDGCIVVVVSVLFRGVQNYSLFGK